MNQEEAARAGNGAQAESAPEHEPALAYTEIVLFCHRRNVAHLVQALEDQIQHAAGALPLGIMWSGISGVLRQGVIVLEWEGQVTPDFLHSLSIDDEIFDYVAYSWTGEGQQDSNEQAEAVQEEENETAGGQLV